MTQKIYEENGRWVLESKTRRHIQRLFFETKEAAELLVSLSSWMRKTVRHKSGLEGRVTNTAVSEHNGEIISYLFIHNNSGTYKVLADECEVIEV